MIFLHFERSWKGCFECHDYFNIFLSSGCRSWQNILWGKHAKMWFVFIDGLCYNLIGEEMYWISFTNCSKIWLTIKHRMNQYNESNQSSISKIDLRKTRIKRKIEMNWSVVFTFEYLFTIWEKLCWNDWTYWKNYHAINHNPKHLTNTYFIH